MSKRSQRRARGAASGQKDASPNSLVSMGAPGSGWTTLQQLLNVAGVTPVNLQQALRNTAFLICSDVIAQDISKAKLRMFKVDGDTRTEVRSGEHPVADFLALRPNAYHTWRDFWDMAIRHLAIAQNTFIAKRVTTRGELRALVPLVPAAVDIRVSDDGDFFYAVSRSTNFDRAMLAGFPDILRADQMIHVKGRLIDGLKGFSTLLAGSDTLSLAGSIGGYQGKLLGSGGRSTVAFLLKEDEALSPEQYERLQRGFQKVLQSPDTPLVLENGADVKSLTMTAKDAEIASTVKSTIVDVCRLFRMPPHKAMHLDAVKYENLGIMERVYVTDTLVPIASRIEEQLRLDLLEGDDRLTFVFEFDRDMMAASDPLQRAEVAKIGVQGGFVTHDEARVELGYDPLPNKSGEIRSIPVNVTLLDDKNEPVLEGQAGATDPNAPGAGSADPLQQPAKPPAKPKLVGGLDA